MKPAVELPAGFNCDQRFRDQTAEQNQDGVQELAMKAIHCDCDQNCVRAHRRRESFIHRSDITMQANTGACV